MFRRRNQIEEPKVELTPMVDVVFLLLIFFMISTTFVETPGISVNLPESSSELLEKEPKEVKVYLTASTISLGDEKLTMAQLQQRLIGMQGQAAESTFVLYADLKVRHGRVVEVMDSAQQAGFTKLAIATEKGL